MIGLCIQVWLAPRSHLPGNTDLPTAWKSLIWAEAVAPAEQEQGNIIPTLGMQQLKMNPIAASRGDLISEKWPRQTVARSSFSDVINDLKIGGVTLSDASLR